MTFANKLLIGVLQTATALGMLTFAEPSNRALAQVLENATVTATLKLGLGSAYPNIDRLHPFPNQQVGKWNVHTILDGPLPLTNDFGFFHTEFKQSYITGNSDPLDTEDPGYGKIWWDGHSQAMVRTTDFIDGTPLPTPQATMLLYGSAAIEIHDTVNGKTLNEITEGIYSYDEAFIDFALDGDYWVSVHRLPWSVAPVTVVPVEYRAVVMIGGGVGRGVWEPGSFTAFGQITVGNERPIEFTRDSTTLDADPVYGSPLGPLSNEWAKTPDKTYTMDITQNTAVRVQLQLKTYAIIESGQDGVITFAAVVDPVFKFPDDFPYKDDFEFEFSPNLTPPPVAYSSSGSVPMLSEAGRLATISRGPQAAAIHVGRLGAMVEVARDGAIAPGTGIEPLGANIRMFGEPFRGLGTPVINAGGEIAFFGGLDDGPVPSADVAIWAGPPRDLNLVARSGDHAPGTPPGVVFSDALLWGSPPPPAIKSLVLGNGGHVAFAASLTGPGVFRLDNDFGIWAGVPGNLGLVARRGDPAAGYSGRADARFSGLFSDQSLRINAAGHVAFYGEVYGEYPYVTGANNSGIWMGGGGDVQLAVRKGMDAGDGSPIGAGKIFFETFRPSSIHINDAGLLAFGARLNGIGVTGGNNEAIFVGVPRFGRWVDEFAIVMRTGDPVPELPGWTFHFARPSSLVLSGSGQVAFRNKLFGPGATTENDEGIFFGSPGDLRMIAREGDHAPGTPDDIVFASDGAALHNPSVNDWGLAFFSLLAGPDVTAENDAGIWAMDDTGVLQLIVRTGDELEVDGQLRTIAELDFLGGLGGEDGRGASFNDLGQLAYKAIFTDGSADVFVSNVVAVPEPSTWVACLAGALCLLLFRKRSVV